MLRAEMSFSRSLKGKASDVWEKGYNHPFVQELGRGTLEREKFKYYLLQDYKYLLEYAKVYAAGALKSETEELMTQFTSVQHSILTREMNLHREYMKLFGITKEESESAKPSLFNRAYTANMMSVGYIGDTAEIIATVFPCAWTYYDYATRLKSDYKNNLQDNPYLSWIETYASPSFEESFEWFYDALDDLCKNKTQKQLYKVEEIFKSSVEFEYLFWEMSYC